ncbi:zinc finger and SCAN domain-containing protein 21-like [Contarinia nasturtii]|uniref:zinc finger and SCAN domain-containing protein 21-like n=1 Tax=Contarinia nasturtii TaxID=265458 RepID=UPI0012D47656|nr:zinc finger and SCAN domain-containing protein 21-like [Contarinia nasturtii]
MALKRSGLSFSAEFKQYFLRTSYDRINSTYNQFEFESMVEDQIEIGSNATKPSSIQTNGHCMTDPVKITESSDEEDGAIGQPKLEQLETTSDFQYDTTDRTSGLNDFVYDDDDGSYTDVKSNGVDSPKDDSQSGDEETDVMMEMDDFPMTVFDVNRDTNSRNERTCTVTSNNRSNVVDDAQKTPSVLTQESLKNKNPNKLTIKKRFKCEFCEYSSNYKGNLNKHTRTHTGEKPYRCDICHKKFTRMEQLKKHKATHTEQVPFHCRGCFQGFSQKAERDGHEKRSETVSMRDMHEAIYSKKQSEKSFI